MSEPDRSFATVDGALAAVEERRAVAAADHARELTEAELIARATLIQRVTRTVMIQGTHYGQIPGTPGLSLLQPGAEVLLSTFRLTAVPHVEDLSGPDHVSYRVRCEIVHAPTGATVGYGLGECSSRERKYAWRKPVCAAEFDATPEDRRILRFQKKGPPWQQVRTDHRDVANTVLKMAHKRALVSAARTTLACSDMFAQDLEELEAAGLDVGGDVATGPAGSVPEGSPATAGATEAPTAGKDKPRRARGTSTILKAIKAADTFDQLNAASDQIGDVADDAARAELRAAVATRAGEIRGD